LGSTLLAISLEQKPKEPALHAAATQPQTALPDGLSEAVVHEVVRGVRFAHERSRERSQVRYFASNKPKIVVHIRPRND
jgi:hypothetical protein